MPTFTSSTMGSYTSKWLVGTAAFELLLAGGFVAGGLAAPEARGGLLLTAVILGVVGIGLLWFGIRVGARAHENQRILQSGIQGTATITSMTQTGMFLNENPQVALDMMVTVPGREPYPVTRKQFVPLILLGRLASGTPLSVKVDPGDPQDVVIDWENQAPAMMPAQQGWWTNQAGGGQPTTIVAPPLITIGGVPVTGTGAGMPSLSTPLAGTGGVPTPGMPSMPSGMIPHAVEVAKLAAAGAAGVAAGQSESLAQVQAALQTAGLPAHQVFSFEGQQQYQVEQLRQLIRANGIEGSATIDNIQDTTVEIGDDHLYVMETTVNVPGQAPHKTGPSAAMVPKAKVGHIALGQTVPVMVAKDNPDLVMFEWEKIP